MEYGISKKDTLCEMTLKFFLTHYGSEIGDYCLKINPTGGLYLLGGVTLGLKHYIQETESGFMNAIYNKGRVAPMI
jgi:glucokinase